MRDESVLVVSVKDAAAVPLIPQVFETGHKVLYCRRSFFSLMVNTGALSYVTPEPDSITGYPRRRASTAAVPRILLVRTLFSFPDVHGFCGPPSRRTAVQLFCWGLKSVSLCCCTCSSWSRREHGEVPVAA